VLEQRIREPQSAEHHPHLCLAQPEVGLDVLLRAHDADPVEEKKKGEDAQKPHHAMANVRGARLGVVVSGGGQSLGRVPEHRAPVHLVVATPAR
jgi:hypothetical protein